MASAVLLRGSAAHHRVRYATLQLIQLGQFGFRLRQGYDGQVDGQIAGLGLHDALARSG
jgi:hypothetical protein